jgi:tetratricopeptide (TPR) repeat protein
VLPLRPFIPLVALALLLPAVARAVGPEASTLDLEPAYRDAVAAIRRQDFGAAIPLLFEVDAKHPRYPEVLNWLGFAHRKLKDYPNAKRFYDAALAIDPDYLPALEYQGMWFIETGDIPAAKRNLERLMSLCAGCEETGDLREALQKAGH